jgi:hypothetical protein
MGTQLGSIKHHSTDDHGEAGIMEEDVQVLAIASTIQQQSRVSATFLIFATGHYVKFLAALVTSLKKHFCPHWTPVGIHRCIIIYTDKDEE